MLLLQIQGLNFALKETLVVSADKRQVTLAYSLVAPTFNPTNAKVVYYDKNAMAISSAPCSQVLRWRCSYDGAARVALGATIVLLVGLNFGSASSFCYLNI